MADDIHLRESSADVTAVTGAPDAAAALAPYALLTFKPEAVPGRRMRTALDFLGAHGFAIAAVAPARYSRCSMRALWRDNWDLYSIDRLALATVMYTAGDALLLLLRDERPQEGVPAAVRLSALRGSAAAAERRPGALRALLDPPNDVLNFVHVADTPADVVRELAVFLDRAERRALLGDLFAVHDGAAPRARAHAAVERLEAACPPHDLDTARSLERALVALPSAADGAERLQAACAERGPKLGWEELCALVDPADARIRVWDFIAIACGAIELWR
jgi:hypothetical protein